MEFSKLMVIAVSSIFVNNFILSRFLGICPFIGVSKKISSAMGMGLAVVFVMTIASFFSSLVYSYILVNPYLIKEFHMNLEYLQTMSFILVIAGLVQLVEIIMKKFMPPLYKALGVYLPLITTNCAILGVAILNIDKHYTLLESVVNGASAGLGFTLALLIMSGIRTRLEASNIPEFLKGTPIAFIIASLLSMAFLGFSGMIVE